jgi:Sugar-transfer associated ATP-grasp
MKIATLMRLPFRAFDLPRLALLRKAAQRYGMSSVSFALRAGRMHLRHGYSFREALSSGVLDPAVPPAVIAGCVSRKELFKHQDRHNRLSWMCLTEDKAVFYAYCKALGLPIIAPHAIFDRPCGWTGTGATLDARHDWERFFEDELPEEFVTKPALGSHGEGVRIYRRSAGGFLEASGELLSSGTLYGRLAGDRRFTRFVIQRRLRNHPDLITLSGTEGLQTIRFVTWIAAGDVKVLTAHLRIITGAKLLDNFDFGRTGNMVANIGWDNGVLAEAVAVSDMELRTQSKHPTTGHAIRGFRIPHWNAARDMVRRAARLFLPLQTVGWDVAIAEDGPVLMEGNAYWDPFNDMLIGPQASPSAQKRMTLLMKQFKGK